MTISVIVPTLGRAATLAEMLESVAACDPLPDEVIVVEGDPGARHEEAARKLEALGLRVAVVGSERGVSKQRNVGMSHARGDIFVFLDDDVSVDPSFFADVLAVLADESIVAATGYIDEPRSRRFIAHGSRFRRFLPGGGLEGQYTRYGYPHYLLEPQRPLDVQFMPGCLMCVRGEAARAVAFDERLAIAEDEDFAFRLTRLGRVRYDPRLHLHHRKLGFQGRSRREFDRELLASRRYIFQKNFEQGRLARIQFAAFAATLFAHRVANRDFEGARGLLAAMRQSFAEPATSTPAKTKSRDDRPGS